MGNKEEMQRVADSVGDISKNEKAIIQDTLIMLANRLIELIYQYAPKSQNIRPEKYAESWKISNITERSVTVSTSQPNLYLFLEFGTAPHPIVGHRKVLHWVDQSGNDRFAYYVRHPGFAAIPHIRPAFAVLESEMQQIIKDAIAKNWKLFKR